MKHDKSQRWVSFGGGVQSTAVMVLAKNGKIKNIEGFIFANVGEDSESPATIEYVEEVIVPYCKKHNIRFEEVRYTSQEGEQPSLLHDIKTKNSIPIPAKSSDGYPTFRSCTKKFKIMPVAKFLRRQGACKRIPFYLALGISLDEIHRAKDSRFDYIEHFFPLLDLKMRRSDCYNVIREEGLEVPEKSACWFCPFHGNEHYKRLRKKDPEMFEKCSDLEQYISKKLEKSHNKKLFLTATGKHLKDWEDSDGQRSLFQDDECDGFCFL